MALDRGVFGWLAALIVCGACFDPPPVTSTDPSESGDDGSRIPGGSTESAVSATGDDRTSGMPTPTTGAGATDTTPAPTTGGVDDGPPGEVDSTDPDAAPTDGTATTDTGGGPESPTEGRDVPGFAPCPAAGPCIILPLGDTITAGQGYDGGYRVELFRLALEGGYDISFTGSQTPNGPDDVNGVTFPSRHGGGNAQRIAVVADRIPVPELDSGPHIILLHAGTNDMTFDPSVAPDDMEALLDELIAEAPDALIVVSNLIPVSFAGVIDDVVTFNALVEPMVTARAGRGAHVIFVDQFASFPEGALADGIHPTEAGYAQMGRVWFEAIVDYLRS